MVIETGVPALDLWQTAPEPGEAGAVAFGGEATAAASVWRLTLPADVTAARQQVAALAAQTQQAEAQLAAMPQRLSRFAQQAAAPEGVAFGADVRPADAELARLLAEVRQPASFAAGPSLAAQMGQQFQAGAGRLFQLLTQLAWVETRQNGQLLGQTRVSWSGDTWVAWPAQVSAGGAALHHYNVRVALAARLTLLKVLVTALSGAAKISALLGMSGGAGALLALPAAWRYTTQILAELEQYRAVVAAR